MATNTTAERLAARAAKRVTRRAASYQRDIDAAPTAKARLAEACRFLRAVADDLDDQAVNEIATEVLKIANGRNRA